MAGEVNFSAQQPSESYQPKSVSGASSMIMELTKKIADIEAQNPNDPRLANLRQQLELLEKKQEQNIKNTFNMRNA
ncbi:MAG: hypothetical protein A2Y25_01100 [Candidatus Melainabacteria bacterium GWF2_37_15]|nr:MAG: hypothetical protein A2Y25_01100 [Candidatus Melainabacteria bacterium GWF2_37_15]